MVVPAQRAFGNTSAILGVSGAYLLAGKLGLLLAIPPGYATAVWLPAGIALAAVLLFGYRVGLGILLGSFLVNLDLSFNGASHAENAKSAVIALTIAVGAVLQAIAGGYLVRKHVGSATALESGHDVAKFLCLGAGVASLVNASWGVGTLFFAELLTQDELLFNWWTWWVGDCIGVLVMTPLALAWLAEPRDRWRRRRKALTIPLVIAFAVSVAFFARTNGWEQERISNGFERQAESIGENLKEAINRYLEAVHALGDFLIASDTVTAAEFRAFVAGALGRYPGLMALSWNPRVLHGGRERWTIELQGTHGPGAEIVERNREGQLVRAAERSEYVPIKYIEPLEKNRAAIGFDVSSEPVRAQALSRARETGRLSATGRIDLVQDVHHEAGILVFLPIYQGGKAPEAPADRQDGLLGYATGVFRVADLVGASIRNLDRSEIEFAIRDLSSTTDRSFLYSNHHADEENAHDILQHFHKGEYSIEFDVGGRVWALNAAPTPVYLSRHRGWQAWTTLAAGLVFTGLLGAFLLVITGRAQHLEDLASSLRSETEERRQAEAALLRLNRLYAVQGAVNSITVRTEEREHLFREACRIAVAIGKFRLAWIGMVDRDASMIKPVAYEGADEGFIQAIESLLPLHPDEGKKQTLVAQAIVASRPLFVNDVDNDPRIAFRNEHAVRGVHSVGALPLVVSGEPVGVLVLHAVERNFFDHEEMVLLNEVARDISFALDHLAKKEQLTFLALYDPITGAANRRLLLDRLSQQMPAVEHERRRLAVMVVDLERFAMVNESFGRSVGDELLKQVAGRLNEKWPQSSSIARIDADQFALVARGSGNEEALAIGLIARVKGVFASPFHVAGHELRVSARVGVAFYPRDGLEAGTVLRNAEAAVKRAKQTGERYLYYQEAMNARIGERLALENKLRLAVERGEFLLHYQPKVSLQDGGIVGVEGLIRWQSPDLGFVSPGRFISLLEVTGLILEVGSWALTRAADDYLSWLDAGLEAPRIAVNVSAIQLRQREFVDMAKDAVKQAGVPVGIDLEITESLIMENIDETLTKLQRAGDLGFRIAIDDFGTGYSSLAYLTKLPVHYIKIDRSFVQQMLADAGNMTLIRTIIELAHSLQLTVIAEGVETQEQSKMLGLLRCDQAQGYLFHKPMPLEQMTRLLRPKEKLLGRRLSS